MADESVKTIGERVVEAMPGLEAVGGKVQPWVQRAVVRGGKPVRNLLDGVWLEAPLHPMLTDLPIGSWTAALIFDASDIATGSRKARTLADGTLALGLAGGALAAVVGLSDWRYLSGNSHKMGVAHGLLNVAGMTLSTASLGCRAAGKRNAGRLLFLAGYSLNGLGAHLGSELTYKYGLRVYRNVFEAPGPDDYVPVLAESELPDGSIRRVEAAGAGILLSRTTDGEVHAIAATCNHFSGPLEKGERDGDTVICPWHWSRFDLRTGEPLEGPAVYPQALYKTRLRDGQIEVKAHEDNVQKKVR